MEPAVLNDPAVYPTNEVLASHLGDAQTAFTSLFERIRASHPDFTAT